MEALEKVRQWSVGHVDPLDGFGHRDLDVRVSKVYVAQRQRTPTLGNVNGVSRKPGPLPHQSPFLWQQGWDFPANKLIADWVVAVRVGFVGVCHFPRSAGATVIVGHRLLWRRILGFMRVKCIAILVLRATDLSGPDRAST